MRFPGKDFRFRRPAESGDWLWNLKGVRRVPYRLDSVLQAPEDTTVFITEGEKDADRLHSQGLITTTNPGGAGKWGRLHRKTVKKAFQGRPVVIIGDNDEPGRAHVEDVARHLQPFAATITIIFLPGLPEKGDVSDYLDTGATKEDLLEIVANAKPWSPPKLDPPKNSRKRPEITVCGGNLPEVVDKAESLILDGAGTRLYQRGNLLVRVVRTTAATARGWFRRVPGALIITPVTAPFLVERLTKAARWIFVDANGNSRIVDCPEKVAKTYLAREGIWRLPNLVGIVEAPTMRPDGSLLLDPGYDPATGLYFDIGDTEFPPVQAEPTIDAARQGLKRLVLILKDFPFVNLSDRATALAAILTAIVRKALRASPMFAFRAPKMASGKSLLADIVAMIATGRVASVMSQGHDDTEDQKRMLALLLEGESVACIDNIDRPFGGSTICSVLTQEAYKGRILGFSRNATVPTTTTWLATGNNIIFVGDITTRVIPCDLDPQCERPEERKFDVNLYTYVPKIRGELVAAALTILRAYHVAGRPSQKLSVFGRFEEWSDLVRSALVWCGEADPCDGMRRIEEIDPIRQQLKSLLLAWFQAFRDRPVTAADVIEKSNDSQDPAASDLRRTLLDVSSTRSGTPNSKSLGHWLSAHEKRLEGDLRIERAGHRQGATLWRVVRVESHRVSSVTSVSSFEQTQEERDAATDPNPRVGPEPVEKNSPKSQNSPSLTFGADPDPLDQTRETLDSAASDDFGDDPCEKGEAEWKL